MLFFIRFDVVAFCGKQEVVGAHYGKKETTSIIW